MKFIYLLLFPWLTTFAQAKSLGAPMVFVHGAHFGPGSFQELRNELKDRSTYAVSIFTTEEDPSTLSLTLYAKRVCTMLRKLQTPAVLVGHSQGGAVINQAYGLCPERIQSLAYLAATIPFPGEKPFELLAAPDDEYYFLAIKENSQNGLFEIVDTEAFLQGFAQDAIAEQRHKILIAVRAEPTKPSKELLSFRLDLFQQMRKLVILTTKDRIITPGTQQTYTRRLKSAKILELETGHLPMVTKVSELAAILKSEY